jgi:hypothetical protein
METISFNEAALVLLIGFSLSALFAGFLGWLLVERDNAPFKRHEGDE